MVQVLLPSLKYLTHWLML